jgi:hypothetical protein
MSATGVFGGRTYDVWFTPEIPVPLGPYKLGGLPGMILQAESRDGKVAYFFAGYKDQLKDHPEFKEPTEGNKMTWQAFEKYVIDDLLRTEALSTNEYTITNNDPPGDWTIEKDKFTIISTYKDKRSLEKN